MPSQQIILFNKPYRVLSQFSQGHAEIQNGEAKRTLSEFIDAPGFYPAGRLDYDSEGLLLLTNSGSLQARITEPAHKLGKSYWVQVEGSPTQSSLQKLRNGVQLKDGVTLPARIQLLELMPAALWQRQPPLPEHREQKSSWLDLTITEGRNRQVRRMFASIELPVLRLVRHQIGHWQLGPMAPGRAAAWKYRAYARGSSQIGVAAKQEAQSQT